METRQEANAVADPLDRVIYLTESTVQRSCDRVGDGAEKVTLRQDTLKPASRKTARA